MSDAVLNIGAVVDKDAITSGMAEGAAGVKQATTNISVYFQDLQSRASSAWKKISDDTRTAASAVSAESLKIAEATKAVTTAQREMSAAMSLARNSSVDEAASMALLAAAQANVRTKTLELKEAQEAVAVVSHKSVTDVQATSAAIRSFEGNPGIRAMENFVAKTLGLGSIMKNLFPIIGGLAFLDILFGMGTKLDELYEKGKNSADEFARGFGEMKDKLSASNDELELQNSKLDDEIAKLSGHPTNGLQTALHLGVVEADKLQEALASDLKTFQALMKEHDVSFFEGALNNIAPTKGTSKEITEFQRGVEKQGQIAEAAYAQQLRAAGASQEEQEAATRAYYARMDEIAAGAARKMRARATDIANEQASLDQASVANAQRGKLSIDPDLTQQRSSFEDAAVEFDKIQRRAQLSGSSFEKTQVVGGLKGDKEGETASNKASEQRLRALELEYDGLKERHGVALKEEHDFWAQRVDEFRKGSEQYKQVQDKIAQIDVEGAAKAHESLSKLIAAEKAGSAADPEAAASVAKAMEDVNRLLREQAEDASRTGERWQSYNAAVAKGAEIAAKLQESMEEGRLRILEQEHGISALGAAQQQAAIHAQEHARALKVLQDELAALQAAGANLKPGDKGYEQNATQQQNVQNQIQQETGQGQVQAQADQAAIGTAISKPYLTAFDAINSGWLKVQRDLIQGNRNISRDFAQMGLGLVQTMAQNFEKMLVQQLQTDMRRVIAHRAANMQNVTDDAAAAATSTGIKKASALQQMFIDAKQAAAGAFAAVAPIPFVGPVLAPIAAGAAFAGVMALAAFEDGGIVGGGSTYQMGVPILAHAGERVLSYDQTQKFESMVNGRGSAGETHIHNYGGNNFSQAGNDFKSQWAAHERHIVKRLKVLRREGKL
jgi:hypothetical protein